MTGDMADRLGALVPPQMFPEHDLEPARLDCCPENFGPGHETRVVQYPHTWRKVAHMSYRGDYQCWLCGHEWWTSWRLGPRVGNEPTLDDLAWL